MEITDRVRVVEPFANVRVGSSEFVDVWRRAEAALPELVVSGDGREWETNYTSGVVGTFRWLTGAEQRLSPSPTDWTRMWPPLPVPGVDVETATPAAVAAIRAEVGSLIQRSPDGYKSASMPPQPGYLEGVRDVIDWASGQGAVPSAVAPVEHRSA
ncbi:hypothetical protein [Kribbella lupini]|uniref:Uncharacterized protein n=1 Tax=Kribbella lupini TaxID=291602 RepID=A0ABN2AZX4_9ACTN